MAVKRHSMSLQRQVIDRLENYVTTTRSNFLVGRQNMDMATIDDVLDALVASGHVAAVLVATHGNRLTRVFYLKSEEPYVMEYYARHGKQIIRESSITEAVS